MSVMYQLCGADSGASRVKSPFVLRECEHSSGSHEFTCLEIRLFLLNNIVVVEVLGIDSQ